MKDTVFLAELPWPEAERRIAAGAPVFLPLGATEQHGHHMAMNVDVVLPTAIAEKVAAEIGGLVPPTIAYGNRSQPRTGGGPAFPGTINITAHTFSLLVKDIICDLHRQKVRRIIVLNGHYENIGPSKRASSWRSTHRPGEHRGSDDPAHRSLGNAACRDAGESVSRRLSRH